MLLQMSSVECNYFRYFTAYALNNNAKHSLCCSPNIAVNVCFSPNFGLFLLLGEGNYVTFVLWHGPSVCRLSVVCNVRTPCSEGRTFRQYFCTV